ncbi:SGNH/GDSL hydrolase family protein [Streptomyces sp. NPDC085479]|uniref:SGNH/GDSL hydrolase family protein n=1 Tax=Streptomyces sp. NPDC085479 TaxID=3365726 RepID=UPI0037D6F3C8
MTLRPAHDHPAASGPSPRSRALLVALCAGAVLGGTALAAHAGPAHGRGAAVEESRTAAAPVGHYAALGDSFSSGLGIHAQTDAVCGRSDRNYPTLVASATGAAASSDVTCAGAETRHVAEAQNGVPPQLDAVRPDTSVVTMGIGGNDLDLAGIIKRCVLLAYLNPQGSPCKNSFTLFGTDEIGSRINAAAPKVASALQAVRAKAPAARVFLVGYPAIAPDDGSACRTTIPLAAGDFAWLRDKTKQLNAMLAQQAAAGGAAFVDTYAPSVGHDACKPAGVRWIDPPTPPRGPASTPTRRATRARPPPSPP